MNHPSSPSNPSRPVGSSDKRSMDIAWGRPVFKAPDITNPRIVFDPLPFRTQFFGGSRPSPAR